MLMNAMLAETAAELIDSMESAVLPRFVPAGRRADLADRDTVLMPWHDLTISFYLPFPQAESEDRTASIVITNKLLTGRHLSVDELFACALQNLTAASYLAPFPEILNSLTRLIGSEFLPPSCEEPPVPVWFVSNRQKCFGASAILCPEVIRELHEHLGERFMILPASVHEVLCLSPDDDDAPARYSDMVREINDQVVEPAERLSDHVYLCTDGIVTSYERAERVRRPRRRHRQEYCRA
ncbi:MAG: DUF5688 family protein [Lachnospiraceae bacterium]|nr:DUF5688 family protein [Lachnospiraceae bacterium]